MAKPSVRFTLLSASRTDADSLKASVETLLLTKSMYQIDLPVATRLEGTQWTVSGVIRFVTQADADLFYAELQALWTTDLQASRAAAGSEADTHVCPHDDAAWYNCRTHPSYARAVK